MLAGLISVTAASANVSLFYAAIIGIIGSTIYTSTKRVIERYEIDDPLDNAEIHGFCGIWSLIAVGIFDSDKGMLITGEMGFLGKQIIGAFAYSFWSLLLSFIFFYGLKYNQRLRCKAIYEIVGQDLMKNLSYTKNNSAERDLQRILDDIS